MTTRLSKQDKRCAYCQGEVWTSSYSIHRDGFGEGPEVPLCNECGSGRFPTCEEIWEAIRKRRARLLQLTEH